MDILEVDSANVVRLKIKGTVWFGNVDGGNLGHILSKCRITESPSEYDQYPMEKKAIHCVAPSGRIVLRFCWTVKEIA
jgi:hypothetical protein